MKRVVLPPLSVQALRQVQQQDAHPDERRVRIGLGRSLNSPVALNGETSSGEWLPVADGPKLWAAEITSSGAEGLRLHLEHVHLPPGSSIRVYSPGKPDAAGAFVTPDSLGSSDEVWTPVCGGETAMVQCFLPSNASPSAVSLEIAELSHIYRGLKADAQPDISCIPQVACHPEWLDTASGVALIQFVDKGQTYLCTGCLLNDADPSTFTDYFLTAHHCIPNATVASTLELFWLYQSDSCGGAAPLPAVVPHTAGGAALLGTSKKSDFTLVQLRQPAPDTATFLGWTTALPNGSDPLACVQHPGGADARISFGQLTDFDATDWYLLWNTGVTEEGSSGSPLLNSEQLVIGQLEGGLSTCGNPAGVDAFGRFDVTYKSIRHWIDNGPFISKQGTYNGLFSETNQVAHESSGFISIRLTDRGTYSGMLLCAGARYSLSGKFNEDGTATKVVTGHGTSLSVNLALDLNVGGSALFGTVSSATWSSELYAEFAPFNAKTNAAPPQGTYTLVLAPDGDNPVPSGYSFGTVKLASSGKLRFTGSMADGASATQSALLTTSQSWPLYLPVYRGKGSALGWLTFTSQSDSDLTGDVSWIKKPQTAKYYPAGFTNALAAVGFRYNKPAAGTLPLGSMTGTFAAAGDGLSGSYTSAVTISTSGKVTGLAPAPVKLSVSAGTGTVTGKFTPTDATRPYSARGVVLQPLNDAFGYFLGTTAAGSMTITTP